MKVRFHNLSKRFISLRGSHYAIKDISHEVNDSEFFVLLGPSGCGKSTLLNMIAGLEKPTGGEIWFNDRLVSSARNKTFVPPKQRNVAMVFQSYALYPHMNVFDNIAFPLRVAGEKADPITDAVAQVAAMLHVSNLLRAKPAELSGGQRQRVAIARAIVRRPDIFLLDEPLSNLDAQLRLSMRAELKNLQRRLNITTIYVTHDQTEAMTLGDRIAVMKDGALEQVGTPDELYSRPANTFVATFIGSPPMNLLEAIVTHEDGITYLIIGQSKLKVPNERASAFDSVELGSHTVGIRPEDILIGATDPQHSVRVEVKAIEPLGRERLLHVSLHQQRLTVLTSEACFSEGETIEIELDLAKIHIF